VYRMLQFFTLLQAYAAGFSILRYTYDYVGESQVFFIVVLMLISGTIAGWVWWYYSSGQSMFCKVAGGAIVSGIVLGLFL